MYRIHFELWKFKAIKHLVLKDYPKLQPRLVQNSFLTLKLQSPKAFHLKGLLYPREPRSSVKIQLRFKIKTTIMRIMALHRFLKVHYVYLSKMYTISIDTRYFDF